MDPNRRRYRADPGDVPAFGCAFVCRSPSHRAFPGVDPTILDPGNVSVCPEDHLREFPARIQRPHLVAFA